MALNLWKLGGQPTSYNPLPVGWNNYVIIGLMDYVLRISAKSNSDAVLRIVDDSPSLDVSHTYNLTREYQTIVLAFKGVLHNQKLIIRDDQSKGDIIIENIELVQKPLPKLTINGIDGFLSGKWSLHANARVIDDETLELNATANGQSSLLDVPCLPNAQYVLSLQDYNAQMVANYFKGSNTYIGQVLINSSSGKSIAFTTPSDCTFIRVEFRNLAGTTGKFTFKRPMLNLGTIPAPYSKKTGDRMVVPVAKKNLLPGFKSGAWTGLTSDFIVEDSKLTLVASTTGYKTAFLNLKLKPNTKYTLSSNRNISNAIVQTLINGVGADNSGNYSFTTDSTGIVEFRLYNSGGAVGTFTFENLMLVEGTTATTYEPYAVQVNKKPMRKVAARTGLRFEGDSYLQLPSMTMDAIEIDCLIDSVQPSSAPRLFSNGSNEIILYPNGVITYGGTLFNTVSGVVINQRTKMKIPFSSVVTSAFSVFNHYSINRIMKGTLYKVTCYLNGQVVAQYDFENPNNIVGDKVLQIAPINVNRVSKNLFDKTKVTLGKYINVGGWLSDSGSSDVSDYMPVEAGSSYIVTGYVNGSNTPYAWFDDRKGDVSIGGGTLVWDAIVAPAGAKYLRITTPKANADTFMVEKGTVRTAYEPYYNVVENLVPNLKNLIPSFEDKRWNLHSNFKVLGRDVGRLDATVNSTNTLINLPVIAGKFYRFLCETNGLIRIYKGIPVDYAVADVSSLKDTTFTADSSYNGSVTIRLTSGGSGSFDFIRPQLYELTGKEATIVGKPIPQRKQAKRSLYAKR